MKPFAILLALLILAPGILWASSGDDVQHPKPAGVSSYERFKSFPVLDNGRVKPMDTFARNLLLRFSGKETVERRPAIEWFAALLFAPDLVRDDRVFLINNPDIATALGLTPDPKRRYSFNQLEPAFVKLSELADSARRIEPKQRSIVEEELIRVSMNVRLFSDLANEMLLLFPHEDFEISSDELRKLFGFGKEVSQLSFLDIAMKSRELHMISAPLEKKDRSQWSQDQKEVMRLLQNFFHWSMALKDMPLAIIPTLRSSDIWVSPWDALSMQGKDEGTLLILTSLRDAAAAYWQGNQLQFDLALKFAMDSIEKKVGKNQLRSLSTFALENFYHKLMPFLFAKIAFIMVFLLFLISFLSANPIWHRAAWGLVIAGFLLQLFALLSRIIILARPPVSNLYETFVFVSCITVALGIWIERVQKRWLGLVVSSISGAAFLFIAAKYSAEGDTLQMLVAVLNSNFWLATHVTTITMGYAATCVAGVLGHIWLIQLTLKKSKEILDNTYQVMVLMLGLALTLTFLGTMLGGVWADQSWGRFWGWDPKENGALMIVLWSAMLFHAKIGKIIGQYGMAVGNVLNIIIVMWAWFGVNLLSIGLHSYGFTSGVATALGIYVACEILFLLVVSFVNKKL